MPARPILRLKSAEAPDHGVSRAMPVVRSIYRSTGSGENSRGGTSGRAGGGASNAGSRTSDAPQSAPPTASFLERHGHLSMSLDVEVRTAQNAASRQRAESSPASLSASPPPATAAAAAAANAPTSSATEARIPLRIVPAMDSFTRAPLRFDPIERKVADGEILAVGRHTDRLVAEHPNAITFKSKVVSRNHAKMWSSNGQWYLQDVGSSSGTFLNHIRLSSPNVPSTPYAVKDGDIVQLGIDFRVPPLSCSH